MKPSATPVSSARRRFAIGFIAALSVAFTGLAVWRAVLALRGEREFPILGALGGTAAIIGLWRALRDEA
ncbi:hypothetical protein Strain138_002210 [Pseudogemmatithrix spongiicola]|uniref:Uncharacterized protein n=1 Tax=Pseudogemmatithrix spongiicola TaxID=3062599 RepID=A0AA49Q8H8_9BACT|nr:hypothetical protein Strain138_002210 [Gemmatimonadaceae bacterium 'strain 138']WKW15806.1 hypothetical protein Strain318_002209 [Gemmatimonadaceae bacterium 'strain 318']